MKKIILFAILLTAIGMNAQVTESDDSESNKWYTGGGLQLGFSNSSIVVGVSPILGYNFNEKLSAGVGLNYSYYSSDFYSTSIFGTSLFGRYLITDALYAQSEFHMDNVESSAFSTIQDTSASGREWVPAFFVGGGYRQSVGSNTYLSFTVLWDIIEDRNSPYFNPYITGGITVGL